MTEKELETMHKSMDKDLDGKARSVRKWMEYDGMDGTGREIHPKWHLDSQQMMSTNKFGRLSSCILVKLCSQIHIKLERIDISQATVMGR